MQPTQFLTKGRRQLVVAELDSSGNGEAKFTNNNSAVRCVVRGLSLRTSPSQSGTQCEVFLVLDYIDTSYFAGTGDTAAGENYVNPGEFINFVWSGGPASGQGLASVYFDEELLA